MRLAKIMTRDEDDFYAFKKELKKAKHAIKAICDLTEEMELKYSERNDDDWDDDDDDDTMRKMKKRVMR